MAAGLQVPILGGNGLGSFTAAAGTQINAFVPPFASPNPAGTNQGGLSRTIITTLTYTSAGTAHNLAVLQEVGRTTANGQANSGQAVINLTAQPYATRNVAANDYLAWDNGDGTFSFGKVLSVSSLAITMTANLTKNLPSGNTVWMFGLTTDIVPATGNVSPVFLPPVSVTTTYQDNVAGIAGSPGFGGSLLRNSPLLVQSNNITAQGTIAQVSFAYTNR